MSDTSYPTFQHYGTNAQRLAFTPAPASGTQPIYIWYETDTGSTYLYDTSWHLIAAGGSVGAWTNITGSVTVAGATVSGGVATVVTPGTTVSFSSIPGTYNHLAVLMQARCSDSATNVGVNLVINSDSGANYDRIYTLGSGTTASAANNSAQTSLGVAAVPAATATANEAASWEIMLPNYKGTTFNKNTLSRGGQFLTLGTGTTYQAFNLMGNWRSTAAITRLDFSDNSGGNFIAGSAFSIYGIT